MRILMDLKDLLEEELNKIVMKDDITPVELDRLDKAVDIIKDIETIWAMKDYSYDEDDWYYDFENRGGRKKHMNKKEVHKALKKIVEDSDSDREKEMIQQLLEMWER